MTSQDVLEKGSALRSLENQMSRLLMLIENPTVEGVDISSSDFTTRYNALKANLDTAETDYKTARDAYTP